MLRKEQKFIVPYWREAEFYSWLFASSCHEVHPERLVQSLYLDSRALSCLHDNLAGLSRRLKFRLRFYGAFSYNTNLNFEIKYRQNNLSGKDLFFLGSQNTSSLTDSYIAALLARDDISTAIFRRWGNSDTLIATLFCSYTRSYFETSDGIRLTVDRHISFSDTFYGEPSCCNLYECNYVVVEVKYPSYLEGSARDLFSSFPFMNSRHSKYAVGMKALGYCSFV